MSEDRRTGAPEPGQATDQPTRAAAGTGDTPTTVVPLAGGEAPTLAPPGAAEPATAVLPPRAGPRVFRNRYEVLSVLGRGGFGAVYKVRDRNFNTPVYRALKTLKTDDDAAIDEVFLKSFESEANTQVNLNHPGIVRVYDYNPDPREPFIVMELVDNGSLLDQLRRHGRLSWADAVDMAIQVAEALDYAHGKGLHAHRDVKPGNIFCPEPGRYQIGDFGIARAKRPGQTQLTALSIGAIGTEGYMAPEQILPPRAVDAKTDEFALAVVLFEVLSGKLPYRTASLNFDPDEDPESARRIVDVSYARAPSFERFEAVPAVGIEAIKRALAPVPAERFPDCRAFAQALRAAQHAPVAAAPTMAPLAPATAARSRTGIGVAVAGSAIVAALGMAVWFWARPVTEPVTPLPVEVPQRRDVDRVLPQPEQRSAALPRQPDVPVETAPTAAVAPPAAAQAAPTVAAPAVAPDAEAALAVARAARDAAAQKYAGSALFTRARAAHGRAEKLLADAEAAREREPVRAATLAGQATAAFEEAASQASKEYGRLESDAEAQRVQAVRARAGADAAGASRHESARSVYAMGEQSFAAARAIGGDAPDAVRARREQYASARQRFSEAAELARPVEPTVAPAVAARPPVPTAAAPPPLADVEGLARGWIATFCAEQDRKMKAQHADRPGVGVRCANARVDSGSAVDVPVSFDVIVTAPDQSLTNEVRDSPPKEMHLRLDCSAGRCQRKG